MGPNHSGGGRRRSRSTRAARQRLHRRTWTVAATAALVAAACVPPPQNPSITVIAPSATIEYGDAIPALEPGYTGLPSGVAEPSTPPTCSTAATATSPPGDYPTTCSGAAHTGATITYVAGAITIEPAPVTVTASDGSMAVGGAVPTITAAYAGLKNGELEPDVLATCSTTATPTSAAGEYPSTCTGAADPNYTFTYVDGTVTVAPAVVTVTASSTTQVYGSEAPAISPSYSGLLFGETEPATPATCSTTATSTSPAGDHPSTCSGAADPNYTFNYVDGTVTVTPAPVVVTASSATVPFGTDPGPVTASYAGLVDGDAAPATPATCSTTATSASPARSRWARAAASTPAPRRRASINVRRRPAAPRVRR